MGRVATARAELAFLQLPVTCWRRASTVPQMPLSCSCCVVAVERLGGRVRNCVVGPLGSHFVGATATRTGSLSREGWRSTIAVPQQPSSRNLSVVKLSCAHWGPENFEPVWLLSVPLQVRRHLQEELPGFAALLLMEPDACDALQ